MFYNVFLLPDRIAVAQFDVRVNGGHAVAWLQRALNLVGGRTLLMVDAVMGPQTIEVANQCDQTPVLRYFLTHRDQRFQALAAGGMSRYPAGWLQRDTDLRKYLAV
jgi:lysozyme family protein